MLTNGSVCPVTGKNIYGDSHINHCLKNQAKPNSESNEGSELTLNFCCYSYYSKKEDQKYKHKNASDKPVFFNNYSKIKSE